jgi:acetyl esterase/lipase
MVETNSVKHNHHLPIPAAHNQRPPLLGFTLLSAGMMLLGPTAFGLANEPQIVQAREQATADQAAVKVIDLWPAAPPAWDGTTQEERDTTDANGRPVADKPVIRLGHVSTPQLHYYVAPDHSGVEENARSKTTILICPGGGYSILAWDLEGTEIAQQFNALGYSAAVVKYRVPTRQSAVPWVPPVQDIQRAVSHVRMMAKGEGNDDVRVGVVGFSAGGNAAARVATAAGQRFYDPIDAIDDISCQVDFAGLIYPSLMVEKTTDAKPKSNRRDGTPTGIIPDLTIDSSTPPMFFAHAIDDQISCHNSIELFSALQANGIPSELHVFASGGHGFGARDKALPAANWPEQMAGWLKIIFPAN